MLGYRYVLRTIGAVVLLIGGATSLSAADTTFVRKGDRVRLRAPSVLSGQFVGDVSQLEAGTLVLLPESGGATVAIPTSNLKEIAVSQGRKSNAVLGLVVGAGVGIASAVGLSIWVCNADDDGCTSGQVVGGSLALTAIGAGLGAGIGALIKTERWREASIPPRVGLGFGRDGSVRLAFALQL